jgi:nucleotide-binding universal stress UspA family protein
MRALLAVLDNAETAPAVLAAAALLARRLPGAQIEVLHARPHADPTFLPTEEIMTPARQAKFAAGAAARSAALRTVFDAWPQAQAATWREEAGEEATVVLREGAKADIVILGRAARPGPGDGRATAEAVLFAGGAPLLLVPRAPPRGLGEHIAVAWKPSETTERAVVAAAVLLRAADRVTVLTGADGKIDRPPPEELVRSLAGLERLPETRCFELGSHAVGPSLLREARAAGADLLVMGAYAHARGMERLLGGATRDVLAAADMPILLHH